ncbi:MAG: hypothetical protein IT464_05365 [Planctomycetes bacterium]|nr:hypothetical protein [Planctomycetota bacterium]
MTQPPEPERIIEAEVVPTANEASQPVKVERVSESSIGPARFASRTVFSYGTAELNPGAIRRMRWRLGLLAIASAAGAGLTAWFAATTPHVLLAAVLLLVCAALVLLAIVIGAAWRLMGRLPH